MKHSILIFVLGIFTMSHANAEPRVRIETNQGTIVVELFSDKAPKSVANFLEYADADFYDDTIFHRVIKNFMVQGGGFTADYSRKPTRDAIENEANNGLQNARGTLAMARTGDPHSATAQFFINHVDNAYLNHSSETPHGWGYAVFGMVVEGMAVVDAIAALPTGRGGPFRSDVPVEPVIIKSIDRLEAPEASPAPEAEKPGQP